MITIGEHSLAPVALGCMNVSHAYGTPPSEEHSIKLLNKALDLGYNMLDTAALYGFGNNEKLLAKAVGHRRNEFFLASKCGMFKGRMVNARLMVAHKPFAKPAKRRCSVSIPM